MTFPFKENFAEYLKNEVPVSQALSDYTPRSISSEPDFTETPKTFQITLTGEQYLRLMSSLFTGTWLVYPNDWLDVYASFWQGLTIMDCDFIADCIANNENVQNALENYLSDSGYGNGSSGGSSVSPDSSASNLIPDSATCTDDNIFGMCMELVETIHQATLEVFEQINASDKYGELFSLMLDNVPLLEVFGLFTEYIGWVKDSAYDDYISAWSTVVQQEIACELFCIAKENCLLTTEDVWNTYKTLSTVDEPIQDLFETWVSEILQFVAGDDTQTVTSVGMIGLAAMRFGGQFAYWTAGIRDLKTTMELAANASDPDWSILCDCPTVPQTAEWDFTVTNGGFVQSGGSFPRGVYESGVGWKTEFNGNEGCLIELEIPANCVVKKISYDWQKNTAASLTILAAGRDDPSSASGQVIYFNTTSSNTSGCTEGENVAWTHRNYILLQFVVGSLATYEGVIEKLRIEYEGDTPSLVTATGIDPLCP